MLCLHLFLCIENIDATIINKNRPIIRGGIKKRGEKRKGVFVCACDRRVVRKQETRPDKKTASKIHVRSIARMCTEYILIIVQ